MGQIVLMMAVVVAAAFAVIGVVLWKTKPQGTVDNAQADKRLVEELENVRLLQAKVEALQAKLHLADLNSATAKANAENQTVKINDLEQMLETYQQELKSERDALAKALAKQQAAADVANEFKVISQEVLSTTLADAKREVGELAATFKKSSEADLEKHGGKIAETLNPLLEKMQAYDVAVKEFKNDTQQSHGSLRHQLEELKRTEQSLHDQAQALTKALSAGPKIRGNYGEMVLRRLVEAVGLQNKYHFAEQVGTNTDEGRKIPDLVVYLPGDQKVLVDAKAVMDACRKAYETEDEAVRKELLQKHCKNVRERVVDLSAKNYFANHQNAVEAVVLFLPAENLYAAAIENDVDLIDFAIQHNIILCGPNSLMLLLKVANQLWRRTAIEEESQKIKQCGDAIYKAACDFVQKYAKIGSRIHQLETEYNGAAVMLDNYLIARGRQMGQLAAIANGRVVGDVSMVKLGVRAFRSPEAKTQLTNNQNVTELTTSEEDTTFTYSAGEEE